MSSNEPLFVAVETLCYYPISTIYDSCPRYLFYALLVASCAIRWTGWLVDVFLGTAAAYAGTAAIQSFILVSSPAHRPAPSFITIPYISSAFSTSNNSITDNYNNGPQTLANLFPTLITNTDTIYLEPAAIELDADAVLAVIITGYLIFLPLQCWSRVLTHSNGSTNRARTILFCVWNVLMLAGTICALVFWPTTQHTPTQYAFCYPDLPPLDTTSSDGWQPSWRTTASWNESIWTTFSNITRFVQIDHLCFYPCFNTSQILRQPTALSATVDFDFADAREGDRGADYSKGYIYCLVVLCVVLNCLLLVLNLSPYKSRLVSDARPMTIWRERKTIYQNLKGDFWDAVRAIQPQPQSPLPLPITSTYPPTSNSGSRPPSASSTTATDTKCGHTGNQNAEEAKNSNTGGTRLLATVRAYICAIISTRCLATWGRFLLVIAILFGLLFSIIISPFTVVAFVIWIEWYIHNDGPAQENPQQVGQWAYPVSIGLLVVSAGIIKLKYWVASRKELDWEVDEMRMRLEKLQRIRDAKVVS